MAAMSMLVSPMFQGQFELPNQYGGATQMASSELLRSLAPADGLMAGLNVPWFSLQGCPNATFPSSIFGSNLPREHLN
jgi:hypothetical protein